MYQKFREFMFLVGNSGTVERVYTANTNEGYKFVYRWDPRGREWVKSNLTPAAVRAAYRRGTVKFKLRNE